MLEEGRPYIQQELPRKGPERTEHPDMWRGHGRTEAGFRGCGDKPRTAGGQRKLGEPRDPLSLTVCRNT